MVLITVLASLVLYLIVLMASQAAFIHWSTLLKTLRSAETLFSIRLSLVAATVASILALAVALPSAYALSRFSFWGRSLVDAIVDIPVVLSPIALGTAILMFFHTGVGTAIQERAIWFVFSFAGIILAQFTVVSALAIRLLKASFDDLDPRYEDVARSLGYNRFQVFFNTTLPLVRNGILAAFILTWARALGEFGATVTVAGATPLKTETLPTGIFLSLSSVDLERTAVLMLVLVLIAIAVLVLVRAIARRRPTE